MKRFWMTALVSCILSTLASLFLSSLHLSTIAQPTPSGDLYYLYQGQRVALTVRQDQIAVAFKPSGGARGERQPDYLQLQEDLKQGVPRDTAPALTVDVKPLGDRYALVKLPTNTRSDASEIEQRVQQRPYVESILPVLTRSSGKDAIVLPNELIVSFQAGLSQPQQQAILDRTNLEIIRTLRFTQNRYLVRSRSASGTTVLGVANHLNQVTGIQSATPNFIQSLSKEIQGQAAETLDRRQAFPSSSLLKNQVAQQPINAATFQTDLL